MKRMIYLLALIAAAYTFLFTACKPPAEVKNTEALLTEIKIGKIKAQKLPEPISEDEFLDPPGIISSLWYEKIYFVNDSDFYNKKVTVVASKGAKVLFAKTPNLNQIPEEFDLTSEQNIPFATGNVLWIEVTSEDAITKNYYRLQIQKYQSSTSPSSVSVSNGTLVSWGEGNEDWFSVVPGTVTFAENKPPATETVNVVTPPSAASTVKYAVINSAGATIPAFTDNKTYQLSYGDFICLEITAQNKVNVAYYKIEVKENPLPFQVDWTALTVEGAGSSGRPTISAKDASGFTVTYGTGGYGVWVRFGLTFPAGKTLLNYNKISFTYTGIGGDNMYKRISFIGGSALPAVNSGVSIVSDAYYAVNNYRICWQEASIGANSSASMNIPFEEDQIKALSGLNTNTGTFGIMIFADSTHKPGDGSTPNPGATSFRISNVVFEP